MLVAASPEILCRVRDREVVNRPLAGTRPRGRDEAEDVSLEKELLADEKERAEHVMLVDLGRNDLGGSATPVRSRWTGSWRSSGTATSCTSAPWSPASCGPTSTTSTPCGATLPVGTVSGAPKIRAMQIIDELEPVRRGPYAGGIGAIDLDGGLDIAIALRTMVIPRGRGAVPGPSTCRPARAWCSTRIRARNGRRP